MTGHLNARMLDVIFVLKISSTLNRHVASVHNKAKPFACSKCDYKAARTDVLKCHMHRHTTSRDFKCSHPQCKESFKTSFDVSRHFSNRHGERNLECDEPGCGRKYANANALYKHKWEFHSRKSLACPRRQCDFSTKKRTTLAAHIIVHDGSNKMISCHIISCEYKGKNSRAVELHMRCHEALLPCPVPGCTRYKFTKKALENHAKRHNPSGMPFKCPFCLKHYTTRDELMRHIAVHLHTREKPYRCGHSDFGASDPSGVKKHICTVHVNLKFPYIMHPLVDRECLRCKVTLPNAELVVHSIGHLVPVIVLEKP